MAITHAFVSAKSDGNDASVVRPSDWNADHVGSCVPPGVIWPYGGSAAPSGFLLCDGAAVSETTYAALFAVIGHTFGGDPGGGNFYVPNLQGISPTGAGAQDINARPKTGPALGEVREDAMQGHWHNMVREGMGGGTNVGYEVLGTNQNTILDNMTQKNIAREPVTDGTNGDPSTGAYTHGPEIGCNWIIRY